jgi:hypothetical protein
LSHPIHTDADPAIHLSFPIRNCKGETTFQDKYESPSFHVVSHDNAIITTDMPHAAFIKKIEPKKPALRIVANSMVLS